jgi:hypothetical protein
MYISVSAEFLSIEFLGFPLGAYLSSTTACSSANFRVHHSATGHRRRVRPLLRIVIGSNEHRGGTESAIRLDFRPLWRRYIRRGMRGLAFRICGRPFHSHFAEDCSNVVSSGTPTLKNEVISRLHCVTFSVQADRKCHISPGVHHENGIEYMSRNINDKTTSALAADVLSLRPCGSPARRCQNGSFAHIAHSVLPRKDSANPVAAARYMCAPGDQSLCIRTVARGDDSWPSAVIRFLWDTFPFVRFGEVPPFGNEPPNHMTGRWNCARGPNQSFWHHPNS